MDQGCVRVLHIISGLDVGGAERIIQWTAKYHDRERYPVGIVSLMTGGALADVIRSYGVPVMELDQDRGRLGPGWLAGIRSVVKRFRPEVVQGHMFHSNLLSRIVRPFLPGRPKVINTIHTAWEPAGRKILYSLTSPFVDGTITFSHDGEGLLSGAGFPGIPVWSVPYGIDVDGGLPGYVRKDREKRRSRLGIELPGPLWIAVGRLAPEKGFGDLIEAFVKLDVASGGPSLLIAGEGKDRPVLERLIREKGVGDRVRLLGLRQDVDELMNACDGFVISSLWEGGPLVLLEAMRAGLPVVSTRVGTVEKMAVEKETALLVEPGRPDQLAQAMTRIMESPSRAEAMGIAGRKRLEEGYDFRMTQVKVERCYDELLHNGMYPGKGDGPVNLGEGG